MSFIEVIMSLLSILEELGHVLVHQHAAWSECLILHGEEAHTLTSTESHRLNSLVMFIHRRLSTLRKNDSDVIVVEPRIIQTPDVPVVVPGDLVATPPFVRCCRGRRQHVGRALYLTSLQLTFVISSHMGRGCRQPFISLALCVVTSFLVSFLSL